MARINKKGMEMTISTVAILVLILIMLAVGIYIIYNNILKPAQGTSSLTSCEGQRGVAVTDCSTATCPPPGICLDLVSENNPSLKKCCIKTTS